MEPANPGTAAAGIEDRALMARVQSGDSAAFAALMERWEVPTKAVIARLTLNASEAEELAQESFVRVWQQRNKFRPGADFRPWLFAIAVNLARNRLRWWRRRPTVSLQEWSEEPAAAERIEAEATRSAAGASIEQSTGAERMERSETATAVRNAIAALPGDLREAIVLFEYEEMSHIEIAEVVRATPKAVETRIHRAKEKLRVSLKALR